MDEHYEHDYERDADYHKSCRNCKHFKSLEEAVEIYKGTNQYSWLKDDLDRKKHGEFGLDIVGVCCWEPPILLENTDRAEGCPGFTYKAPYPRQMCNREQL